LAIQRRWNEIEAETGQFIELLNPGRLPEVAAMLTHFGFSPGNLDYLVYMDRSAQK